MNLRINSILLIGLLLMGTAAISYQSFMFNQAIKIMMLGEEILEEENATHANYKSIIEQSPSSVYTNKFSINFFCCKTSHFLSVPTPPPELV